MRKPSIFFAAAAATLLTATPDAFANGQTTHVWITKQATSSLPEGELKTFLSRPELQSMLLNGTMFPDGGYAMKSPYGEAAHWDPFRIAYRTIVLEKARGGWSRDAEEQLAFLFGLASHGITDEFHDATYMERSREVDGWSDADFDTAADVVFAAEGHAQAPPGVWAPVRALADAFRRSEGLSINVATMLTGQTLLQGAIAGVATLSVTPFVADGYRRKFPWAMGNLGNAAVLGSPPSEAQAVALYWQQLWARAMGGGPTMDPPLLAAYTASSSECVAARAATTDSRVVLLFREGLRRESVTPDTIHVETRDGRRLPIRLNLFYGNSSHTVLVIPEADWPQNEPLEVVIDAGGPTNVEGVAPTAPYRHPFCAK